MAVGAGVSDWFKGSMPGQENLELDWSQAFSKVEALSYNVDAAVTLVPVSGAVGFSAWSKAGDEHGYFEFRAVNPGRYLVGIGIAAQPGSPEWESRVYYPGVRSKEEAVAVGLGEAEKRSDINFQLPNLAAP